MLSTTDRCIFMHMESTGLKIAAAREAKGWNQSELGRALGVTPQSVQAWESGRNTPRPKRLQEIAAALGVSTAYLMGEDSLAPITNIEPGPDIKGLVPLISWVQAGSWCEVEDLYAVGDAEEWMPCPTSHGPRTYALRVRGESMFNPNERRSFRQGDIIYVDPDKQPENGSMVIVKLDDSQEATFKQLVIEGGERYLKALNPNWPDQIIRINGNATICGVVIGKYEVF